LGVEPAVSRTEAARTCASNIQLVVESTRKALQHTAEKMIQRGEASRLEAPEYSVGQEKWIGPYKVLSIKPNVVELRLPKTLHIHPVVNVSWVKPYKGP
ncbi:hypothetical protein PISMIDRAFT_34367, partial [Pisolithus microcarpus 441]